MAFAVRAPLESQLIEGRVCGNPLPGACCIEEGGFINGETLSSQSLLTEEGIFLKQKKHGEFSQSRRVFNHGSQSNNLNDTLKK